VGIVDNIIAKFILVVRESTAAWPLVRLDGYTFRLSFSIPTCQKGELKILIPEICGVLPTFVILKAILPISVGVDIITKKKEQTKHK
jgi:hypothetical protein